MRVAVITPYYKESAAVLRQCHQSVMAQTATCAHILVADGYPKSIFRASPRTEHVVLPRPSRDVGNTPRYIGSILADTWGFDAVAYLDADNWYAPDHIERLTQAHRKTNAPIIACKRMFHDLDGNLLVITEPAEDQNRHIDTSCFFITRAAFSLFRTWRMPKPLGPVGDRVFLEGIAQGGFEVVFTDARTVAFRTQYAYHYHLAGKARPVGAKEADELDKSCKFVEDENNRKELIDSIGFIPAVRARL